MLQVNLTDKTNLSELVALLENYQQDEIILTKDNETVAKILPEEKAAKPKRYFGMFKDELNLPPNFDEVFDAADAEILETFYKI